MKILLRPVLAGALTLTMASGGPLFAQAATGSYTASPAAREVSRDARPPATGRLTEAAKRQAGNLGPKRPRRNQGWPPPPPPPPAWIAGLTVGVIVGGYAGMAMCHCERDGAAILGSALGGIGGALLVRKLTR